MAHHGKPGGNNTTGNVSAKRRRKWRARLFEQQNGLCHWCKGEMTLEKNRPVLPAYATFEHLHPHALGGRMTADNIVLACHACNEYRGGRLNSALQRSGTEYVGKIALTFNKAFVK